MFCYFQKEQLATITPKSDVWSLGILILELLAHTPQMNPKLKHRDPIELFGEMRSEWVGELLTEGVPFALKFKEFFHFLGHRDKVKVEDRDIKMGMHMKELKQHFPRIFAILTVNKRAPHTHQQKPMRDGTLLPGDFPIPCNQIEGSELDNVKGLVV